MTRNADEHELLELGDYRRLHRLVDEVAAAGHRADVREHLLDGLGRHFGWRSATFFTGSSLQNTFADRGPVLSGVAATMGAQFIEHFWPYDVFSLPQNRAVVRSRRAASLDDLHLPRSHSVDYYLQRFLGAHGVRSEILMLLRLAPGTEAIVGVLDGRPRAFGRRDLAVCRVLARSLERVITLDPGPNDPLATLSAREREVAALVGDGLDNAEVARTLFVSVDTVKKHLTSAYQKSGCRSRAELVRMLSTRR